MSWFHTNVAMPVIQNLLASGAAAAAIVAGGIAVDQSRGCSAAIIEDVSRGEGLVLRHSYVAARRVAADVVAAAPACGCGHELRARIDFELMAAAVRGGRDDLAERFRAECYADALAGQDWWEPRPAVGSLRVACKA